jgi:hypothetical protein
MGSEKQKCCISRISVAREIKQGRMEWAGHVARVNEKCMQGFGGEDGRIGTTLQRYD